MKTKQLVCNDCGCRFEIKDAKEHTPQTAEKEKGPDSRHRSESISCPECRSYNVTTA